MNSEFKRLTTVTSKYGVDNVSKLKSVQDKRKYSFAQKRNMIEYHKLEVRYFIDGNVLTLYRLNKDIADDWLNKYHPLKAPRGNLLSLGLVDKNQIICIMTFKKPLDKSYDAQLSRMWTLPKYEVIDGYSLLSQYASQFGLNNIVAYVNRSFEDCNDYEKIGMNYVRDIQRTKWWVNKNNMISDASRRQKHISQEQLIEQGWLPVYDCGQAVYQFK